MPQTDLREHGRERTPADDHAVGDVLERVSDAVVALDRNWRYTYVNRRAASLFGRRPEDLIGRHIWTEFPEGVGQPFHRAYERAMADQVFVQMENYYEPWDRWFENRIYPSPDGLSIFFHEITERKQAEQSSHQNAAFLEAQNDALERIVRGAPLGETLDCLLRAIEAQSPGMLCSILLLDADGVHVHHGAAPSLPDSFLRAIDGQRIGPRAGSCGTAAFRREPVIVEDIATDPLWEDYRGLALTHELRACWSTPIFDAERQVLGTFALYFRSPGRPTHFHLQLIEMATHAAAVAIVHDRDSRELRTSEERLRLAVTGGNVGIWEWDFETERLVWNDELILMWGWPSGASDLTLKNVMRMVVPEDRPRIEAALERSVHDGTACDVEYRVRRHDDSIRWIAAKGRPEYDAAGRPVRMIGVAIDITDRIAAEDQLRRSEDRFQVVARATNDVIWDWDLAAGTVWWNQGITTLFEYAPRDVGSDAEWRSAHIHPEDRDTVVSRIRAVMKKGDHFWSGEYRFRRANGSYADVLDRGFVLYNTAHKPIRMIGAIADISERKRAFETLEQRVATRTAELQARNDELKAFAYTVSHDLKAPLRGIAGYTRELDRQHRACLNERGLWCVAQILTATRNLDRLIEDLLHYSRLDSQTPTASNVDVAAMVDAILRDRKPVIAAQGTEVTVRLSVKTVSTWERGLFQALTNLIDNAIKYSRKTPQPVVRISSEDRSDHIRITVADNGIGFDMKYHDRMFGLFNRLVRQEDFEGTGAGLAIVKKVVEKMGASVRGESSPGAGSTFVLELPVRPPAHA
jgi:PAS domain S-box-containing protein